MKIADFGVLYDWEDEPQSADGREAVSSAADSLVKCINKYGRVDLDYMSEISRRSKDELISALSGKAMFQNPSYFVNADEWEPYEGWMLSSQYLCGCLPEKIRVARKVNAKFRCFDKNISALESLMPSKVDSMSIHIALGATWIPTEFYEKFIAELLKIEKKSVSVIFNRSLAVYRVEVDERALGASVLNIFTYGTPDMKAVKIVENTMNAKSVKVYDYNSVGKNKTEAVLNQDKTVAVQKKQAVILSKFEEWIHENANRLNALCELYNDHFVGYTFTQYDGSFLDFDGLNPEVTLYPHQKNAVARMLLSPGNLLLAHDVGTGKTYEIVCGVHELYRTKLSTHNLIVVPNSVLEATVNSHRYLYPDDKIFVIKPSDFTPANRNALLEKVKDGDFVCTYMAFSSFDMIVMSKEYWVTKQQSRIKELKKAAAAADTKREKKMLSAEAARLSKKLADYIKEKSDCPWLTFDRLGIETLVVDEAHNYKNIKIKSRAESITGLTTGASKKCIEMYEKSQFTKKLIFATGTPLTNSLADIYIMQKYLQPQELKYRQIDTLDTWVNTFAERESLFEVDVDSRHLKLKTSFTKFNNIPELMAMFSNVCDFYHDTDKADCPFFEGYEEVKVRCSEMQKLYVENLSARADAVHARRVSVKDDNLLKITTDGRLCALDIRLADSELFDDAAAGYTKTAACADKIMSVYKRNPGTSQIVFSDIGTPKQRFNVYDELKKCLVERGMDPDKIAYIHDASTDSEKTRLFAKVNNGQISVIIGSTAKLGTGVNVQQRLVALHHLDVPWKPADMIQREGRLLRAGNTCEKVKIYHYVTEGTFDSFSWQLLEKKARFLESFLAGVAADRDAEEIDNMVLRYSDIKGLATGNPLIKERFEIANRLDREKIAFRNRHRELLELRTIIEKTPAQTEKLRELIDTTERDIALYADNKESVPADERLSFGEELTGALACNVRCPRERLFCGYQGFEVYLPAGMRQEECYMVLGSANGGAYRIEVDIDKPNGCTRRIDYMLDHLSDRVSALENSIKTAVTRMEQAKDNLEKGNPHRQTVDELTAQLDDIDRRIKEAEEAEKEEKAKKEREAAKKC